MKRVLILSLLIVIVALSGCTERVYELETTTTSIQKTQYVKELAYITVGGSWINWDADIEDDGISANIDFYDENNHFVEFEDIPVTIIAKLYTSKLDENFEHITDKLVCSKIFYIKSNDEVDFLSGIYGTKVKFPIECMTQSLETSSVFELKRHMFNGLIEVTAKTPKQGNFSTIGYVSV